MHYFQRGVTWARKKTTNGTLKVEVTVSVVLHNVFSTVWPKTNTMIDAIDPKESTKLQNTAPPNQQRRNKPKLKKRLAVRRSVIELCRGDRP